MSRQPPRSTRTYTLCPTTTLFRAPLHPARQRRRGYNQSVELARALRRIAGLRVEANWARRVRRTDDQIGMTAVARRRNVAKAFVVDPQVRGLRIALLAAVRKTGATLGELPLRCLCLGSPEGEAWAISPRASATYLYLCPVKPTHN